MCETKSPDDRHDEETRHFDDIESLRRNGMLVIRDSSVSESAWILSDSFEEVPL